MNYAARLQKTHRNKNFCVAFNPLTEQWEKGRITGTWSENLIGSFDQGFYIQFDEGEIQQVSSLATETPTEK